MTNFNEGAQVRIVRCADRHVPDMDLYVKKEDVWKQLVAEFGSNFHLSQPRLARSLAELGIAPQPKMKRLRIEFDTTEELAEVICSIGAPSSLYGTPLENSSITEVNE